MQGCNPITVTGSGRMGGRCYTLCIASPFFRTIIFIIMYLYEKKKKAVNLNRHTCINCKSKRYEDELIKLNVDGSGY